MDDDSRRTRYPGLERNVSPNAICHLLARITSSTSVNKRTPRRQASCLVWTSRHGHRWLIDRRLSARSIGVMKDKRELPMLQALKLSNEVYPYANNVVVYLSSSLELNDWEDARNPFTCQVTCICESPRHFLLRTAFSKMVSTSLYMGNCDCNEYVI